MPSIHVHGKRTEATLVTATGITFTVCDCGVLVGGIAPLGKRIAQRVISGSLMVTTPHRAGGAYGERASGGVYATINPKARLLPLIDQLSVDGRFDIERGMEILSLVETAYAVKG